MNNEYNCSIECISGCIMSSDENLPYTVKDGVLVIHLGDSDAIDTEGWHSVRIIIEPKRADILSLAQQDPKVLQRMIS